MTAAIDQNVELTCFSVVRGNLTRGAESQTHVLQISVDDTLTVQICERFCNF
jgi:hypothetical protein